MTNRPTIYEQAMDAIEAGRIRPIVRNGSDPCADRLIVDIDPTLAATVVLHRDGLWRLGTTMRQSVLLDGEPMLADAPNYVHRDSSGFHVLDDWAAILDDRLRDLGQTYVSEAS